MSVDPLVVFGLVWVGLCVVGFVCAVGWVVVRDAIYRRVQLHRLRVIYARTLDHAHARDRHRLIATMGAQLAEIRELPERQP